MMRVWHLQGDLHIWDVTGCFGLVNQGDAVSVAGTFTLAPKQTITYS